MTRWLGRPGHEDNTVRRDERAGTASAYPGDLYAASDLSQERFLKSILVPTDFAPADARTLEQAVGLAHVFDAKLTLLHVIDINDPAWVEHWGDADSFMRQLRARAQDQMERLVALVKRQYAKVEGVLVEGLPPQEIAQYAHNFDFIVMRRPRPEPVWSLFSKRTGQRVLDEAECGVLALNE